MNTQETNTNHATTDGVTWLTTEQMACRLNLHEKTILRLARARVIPCLRAGRAVRFDPEAVERALIQRAAA